MDSPVRFYWPKMEPHPAFLLSPKIKFLLSYWCLWDRILFILLWYIPEIWQFVQLFFVVLLRVTAPSCNWESSCSRHACSQSLKVHFSQFLMSTERQNSLSLCCFLCNLLRIMNARIYQKKKQVHFCFSTFSIDFSTFHFVTLNGQRVPLQKGHWENTLTLLQPSERLIHHSQFHVHKESNTSVQRIAHDKKATTKKSTFTRRRIDRTGLWLESAKGGSS